MTTLTLSREKTDLLETLAAHRSFLRFTARELTDEQAARRTTVSELTLGGLIKHVTAGEAQWARFMIEGAEAFSSWDMTSWDEAKVAERAREFQMSAGETLESLLAEYEGVAATTERLVSQLPNLDSEHPLPDAPWFQPGARWSARRALLHVIAETAQHAGHADIIRESLDGAKTMG